MATDSTQNRGCGYVVSVVLLLGGGGLLSLAASQLRRSGHELTPEALVPGVIGVLMIVGAFFLWRLAGRFSGEAKAEAARKAQFPDQPWKWKKEWAGPAIAADSEAGTVVIWFFALFWNVISWTATGALLSKGISKPGEYFVFLFPVVGLLLLWAAIYQTMRARKYGRARFVPSSLPGVIGGYLGGVIEVPANVTPEADARIALKCIRREVRGSGKNRSVRENVLWEREELIARDKWAAGAGGTRIPVLFYIPAGQPQTDASDRNNEIIWRLSASAATVGVDFATGFKVPVFATGETAAPPEAGAPVLEEYTPVTLDASALAACGVRREGDTFHFNTGHLPGTRLMTALLMLGFAGLFAWFVKAAVPVPVWFFTLFFAAIIALFAFDVWFARFELRIEVGDVVVTQPRPWGTKVTRVPRTEVAAVRPEKSMSSGESQYYRLKLEGAQAAPGMPGAEESFLVRKAREMAEAKAKQTGRSLPPELAAQLANRPKFSVVFAKHVPGQTKAEAIGALVLAAVRGK
ncbi:MAG: hypothetical protein QG602_430 [Verrucomicrobiota bacterium]|nr:hypothetical protein [Verrucomicrobiota bacterium]